MIVDPCHGAPGHVDIQRLDIAWAAAASGRIAPSDVILDLRLATYIDQEVLLFLVSALSHRHKVGLTTTIRLPEGTHTLDFLRAWELPRAIRLATDRDFVDFLEPEDRKRYIDAELHPPRYVEVATLGSGGSETLLPISFFAITPVSLANASEAASLVRDEWLDGHVVGVLERHLGPHAERIATNVIHEGVLNASTHPGAGVAMTSSQVLTRPRPTAQPLSAGDRELVLAIWDDGASFRNTLADAMREHGRITSPAYGLVEDTFHVTIKDRQSAPEQRTLRSTEDLSHLKRQSLLTAAAFFLGVTSTPLALRSAPQDHLHIDGAVPRGALRHTGIGLHAIRRTVVDLFGGSILYASGHIRMSIAGSTQDRAYDVGIRRLESNDAYVEGNLLVARLRLPLPTSG